MVRTNLVVDGERFMQYRRQIGAWLFAHHVSVQIEIHPNRNRVTLLFDTEDNVDAFVEHFEGL